MTDIKSPGAPPIPEYQLSHKELKALAKARRPWFRKKRFWGLGVIALIVVASAIGSAGSSSKDSRTTKDSEATAQADSAATPAVEVQKGTETTAQPASTKLFPGRVDAQKEDQERNIGEAAKLSGYTTTVTSAAFQQSISDFETRGYVVVDVTIENRDQKAQSYNPFDFKLQTPNGQVIDMAVTSADTLHSGDLVHGGSVSGKVTFEVGPQKGDFYVIYKPDAFDAARGIWKVTV